VRDGAARQITADHAGLTPSSITRFLGDPRGIAPDVFVEVLRRRDRLGGGDGSLVRTLLGVVVIAVLGNGLNLINVSSYIQLIVIGAIIIAAVGFDLWRREHGSAR